jgi:hypothetical protein
MKKVKVGLLFLMATVFMLILAVCVQTGATEAGSTRGNGDNAGDFPHRPAVLYSMEDKLKYPPPDNLSTPLPESEIARIVFSKAWLLQNDEDAKPDVVKITFPTTWVDEKYLLSSTVPPVGGQIKEISADEPIVMLSLPKEMLKSFDINQDPDIITISYPADKLEFYKNIAALALNKKHTGAGEVINEDSSLPKPSISTDDFYSERAWYFRNPAFTA